MKEKDPVGEFLRKRGCPEHVVRGGLRGLAESWEEVVRSVEEGYSLGLDDYLNDMDGRQLLDETLAIAPRRDQKDLPQANPAGRCENADARQAGGQVPLGRRDGPAGGLDVKEELVVFLPADPGRGGSPGGDRRGLNGRASARSVSARQMPFHPAYTDGQNGPVPGSGSRRGESKAAPAPGPSRATPPVTRSSNFPSASPACFIDTAIQRSACSMATAMTFLYSRVDPQCAKHSKEASSAAIVSSERR